MRTYRLAPGRLCFLQGQFFQRRNRLSQHFFFSRSPFVRSSLSWLLLLLLCASPVLAQSNQVPQGGSLTFGPSSGGQQSGPTWQVKRSGSTVATSLSPIGWSVSWNGSQFTVGAPTDAVVGTGYTVNYNTGGGGPNGAFEVISGTGGGGGIGTPTNLSATPGNQQIALSWSAVTGAASYRVKRAAASAGPYTVIASPTTTSYTDTGLADNATFFYMVSAVDAASVEGTSAGPVNATTSSPLATPTSVSARSATGQASIAWTGSTGASGYRVRRATSSAGPFAVVGTIAASPYTDAGLANGTTYYYTVSAYNALYESNQSAPVNATPLEAPSALMALATKDTQINLYWTYASTTSTTFSVERKEGPLGTYAAVGSATGQGFMYADTGLTAGTTYFYRVRATISAGNSSYSNEASSLAATTTQLIVADMVMPMAVGLRVQNLGQGTQSSSTYNGTSSTSTTVSHSYSWYRAGAPIGYGGGPNAGGIGTDVPVFVERTAFTWGSPLYYQCTYTRVTDSTTTYFDGRPTVHSMVTENTDLGEIVMTPQRANLVDNQAVDSRIDPRYGNAPPPINHKFKATTYRGGLFAGYSPDPSRVGRSFLRFSLPAPVSQPLWTGSVYAYYQRLDKDGNEVIGAQRVAGGWDAAALAWSTAPAFDPAAAGMNCVTLVHDSALPSPGWVRWKIKDGIAAALAAGPTLEVGLAGRDETLAGWAYLTKKEFNVNLAAYAIYGYGQTVR